MQIFEHKNEANRKYFLYRGLCYALRCLHKRALKTVRFAPYSLLLERSGLITRRSFPTRGAKRRNDRLIGTNIVVFQYCVQR